ncbi:MAG TPA: response regulator [Chroococcales cyanobacterium]
MRTLLVEDSPADADILREVLSRDCFDIEIECVERLEEALRVLDEREFDIILLDLSLPDSDSLTGLMRVRVKAPRVPIIIFTGLDDHELGLEAVKHGAQDYLVKGRMNGESIARAMRYAIERHRTEQISLQNELAAKEAAARAEEVQTNLEMALLSSGMYVWSFNIQASSSTQPAADDPDVSMEREPSFQEFISRVHPDDRTAVRTALQQCIDGQENCNVEFRAISAQGANRWFAYRGKALFDTDDKPFRITGVCREITAEKLQEENSKRLAILEQRHEFVALLAHDLKTPIMGCQRILDLIVGGALGEVPPERAGLLRQIRDSNQSMLLLINNVMDTYRLEEGSEVFSFEDLDMGRLISDCVSEVRALAEGSGIEIEIEAEPIADVYADRIAMRRVVCNLLSNAIKYTPAGGRVTITVRALDDRALVQVADSGVGIETDALDHIFERFYQEKQKYRSSGLGLGLYLCQRLMKAQNGSISCSSQPGKGTTFELSIPRSEKHSRRGEAGAAVALEDDCGPARGTVSTSDDRQPEDGAFRLPQGVLVIDNNRANRLVLRRVLRNLSIVADFVTTPAEALQATAERTYAAIFVNLVMPDLPGLEMTKTLRRAGVSTPILAYGQISVPEHSAVREAGFDDFLCEPLTNSCVKDLVLKWIRDKRSTDFGTG